MATISHAKEDEGPVEDIQNARQTLVAMIEAYRNARDAIGLTGEFTAMVNMNESVRALEGVDKALVRAVVKLKKLGVK